MVPALGNPRCGNRMDHATSMEDAPELNPERTGKDRRSKWLACAERGERPGRPHRRAKGAIAVRSARSRRRWSTLGEWLTTEFLINISGDP